MYSADGVGVAKKAIEEAYEWGCGGGKEVDGDDDSWRGPWEGGKGKERGEGAWWKGTGLGRSDCGMVGCIEISLMFPPPLLRPSASTI